jgi:hypothetical protein
MIRQLIVIVCCLVVSSSASNYIVGNYYEDASTCGGNSVAEVLLPMGKCIQVPDLSAYNITVPPVKSLTATCTQNADGSVKISAKGYASSSSCSGLGIPVPYTLPAGCNSGATMHCGDTSPETSKWPAAGIYFGDSSCAHFDAMASILPDTCTGASNGDSQGSEIITVSDTTIDGNVYTSLDCSGELAASVSKTKGVCEKVAPPSIESTIKIGTERERLAVELFANTLVLPLVHDNENNLQTSGASIFSLFNTADAIPL